jgi:hypothetical protein
LWAGGLVHQFDTVILLPSIVGVPRLRLRHDLVAHHRLGGQQPEQAELRESAENETGVLIEIERREPSGMSTVVLMNTFCQIYG